MMFYGCKNDLYVVDKLATPQHEGVSPFTGEPMTHKARVAQKVIKMRLLKALKDAVSASRAGERTPARLQGFGNTAKTPCVSNTQEK